MSRLFQSKLILVALFIITVVSAIRLTHEISRRVSINAEISELKSEIQRMQDEQRSPTSFIEYLKTDTYIEEQARKRLNLRKPGENVVVVENTQDQSLRTRDMVASGTPALWWNYFFSNEKKS